MRIQVRWAAGRGGGTGWARLGGAARTGASPAAIGQPCPPGCACGPHASTVSPTLLCSRRHRRAQLHLLPGAHRAQRPSVPPWGAVCGAVVAGEDPGAAGVGHHHRQQNGGAHGDGVHALQVARPACCFNPQHPRHLCACRPRPCASSIRACVPPTRTWPRTWRAGGTGERHGSPGWLLVSRTVCL